MRGLVAALLLVMGAGSAPLLAEEQDLETFVRNMCAEWAEEEGVPESGRAAWIERCVAEEMEAAD